MTSKKALDWLVNYLVPFHFHANEENRKKIDNLLSLLKQDLERLEVLEKENEQLKGNETIICDYAYSLKQENEALKKVIEKHLSHLEALNLKAPRLKRNDICVCLEDLIDRLKEVLGE